MKRALIIWLVLALSLWAGVIVGKADGGVAASVEVSDLTPVRGQRIWAGVWLQSSELVGSYSASLAFDPAVLAFRGCSGPAVGFAGVSRLAGPGLLRFSGANPYGAAGRVRLVLVAFDVVGVGPSALDLGFSAMAAARSFADLLPALVITDARVVARPLRWR
jgi:hypothetical protein